MIQIKNSYFKGPDNNRYFRRNSHRVEVGSYGEKKTPLMEANYLAVNGHIKFSLLDGNLKTVGSGLIDWSSESKTDIEADVTTYFDIGGVKLNFTQEKAQEAQLKLLLVYTEPNTIKRVLNNEANIARQEMKKEGKDARICTSAWVVMSGRLAKRFISSARVEAAATTSKGLKITANGGSRWKGSETIELIPGSVFAYALHKVKFEGEKISEMEDDWQGFN